MIYSYLFRLVTYTYLCTSMVLIAQVPEVSVPIAYHFSRGSNFPQHEAMVHDIYHKGPEIGTIQVPITKLFIAGLKQSNPGLVELALRHDILRHIQSCVLEDVITKFISNAVGHERKQQESSGGFLATAMVYALPFYFGGAYKSAALITAAGMVLSALSYLEKSRPRNVNFTNANNDIIGYLLYYRVFDHPDHQSIHTKLQDLLLGNKSQSWLRFLRDRACAQIQSNKKIREIYAKCSSEQAAH